MSGVLSTLRKKIDFSFESKPASEIDKIRPSTGHTSSHIQKLRPPRISTGVTRKEITRLEVDEKGSYSVRPTRGEEVITMRKAMQIDKKKKQLKKNAEKAISIFKNLIDKEKCKESIISKQCKEIIKFYEETILPDISCYSIGCSVISVDDSIV